MIKCFIVESLDSNTPRGKFDKSFYVAKISNNNPNTIAILDDNRNWIPFKWYTRRSKLGEDHYSMYFYILDNFLIKNKKELNSYIANINFDK